METQIDIEKELNTTQKYVQEYIDRILPKGTNRLFDAMRYSALTQSKGIRSFILIETAKIYNIPLSKSLPVATAIELIHTYSLIHDDLPAMDNDELRRGKPSCHIKFDEATAILAGDSLLTFAFELISSEKVMFPAEIKVKLLNCLTKSIGSRGMAGGQMLDILYEKTPTSAEETIKMQKMKTADFIASSCQIGAILGEANPGDIFILKNYATAIGLTFQIVDDLLDVEGNESITGKKLRKDKKAGKSTLIDIMGTEQAKIKAHEYTKFAIRELKRLDYPNKNLENLANFIFSRKL